MGRITLLRHTTPDVAPGTCYGRSDLGLAATFAQEAEAVLAGLPAFDHLISSPLTRCRRLAETIAEARGMSAVVADLWTEMDFGNWEGQAWSALPRAELDAWAGDFLDYHGHGGESVSDLRARIQAAQSLLPAGKCLVVTHMGCIKAAHHIAGDPSGWDYKLPFGKMTEVDPSSC